MPLDEEFAQKIESAAVSATQRFFYRIGRSSKPPKNRLGLGGLIKDSWKGVFSGDPQAEADAQALAASGVSGDAAFVEGHVSPQGTPFLTLAAHTPEEAAEISGTLADHNVEHYLDIEQMGSVDQLGDRMSGWGSDSLEAYQFEQMGKNPNSGFYEIYLPDRELERMEAFMKGGEYPYHALINPGEEPYLLLKDLPEDLRGFVAEYEIGDVRGKLAMNAACLRASDNVAWNEDAIAKAKSLNWAGEEMQIVDLDDPETPTFSLKFETVPWDADAEIVTNNLTELKIPFKLDVVEVATNDAHGLVNITVPEFHTGYVKEFIDKFSDELNIRGFNRERFPNYGELEQVAEHGQGTRRAFNDHVFRSLPWPEKDAMQASYALQELGIEHEVMENIESNTYQIILKESEYRLKADQLNRMGVVLERTHPPEYQQEAQQKYEKAEVALKNSEKASMRLKRLQERREALRLQTRNRERVSRDVKVARKAAAAQKSKAVELNKKQVLGK